MNPIRRADGAITNAVDLIADQVVHEIVLCPCCEDKVFKMWPEGWDAHAAHCCAGLTTSTIIERKKEFREKYDHLFRKSRKA